jgi:NAD+ kinase
MKFKKIGITADESVAAQNAKKSLIERYGFVDVADAKSQKSIDALVAVGGDGFMLHTLHNHLEDDVPVYGVNKGTVGFLMNDYKEEGLIESMNNAVDSKIHPLKMKCKCADGSVKEALAINEVSILRTTGQAAKVKISVDGTTHLDELVCDGVLVSTPAGSSAYNYSNGGMILPISSNLLSLTPISPFRPRRWRGALLPNTAKVKLEVLRNWKRPVKAVADNLEVDDISEVEIVLDTSKTIHLLFDSGHSLEDRIMREMFEIC